MTLSPAVCVHAMQGVWHGFHCVSGGFRRLDGARRFRLFGTRRRYEVHFDDGSILVVAPTALDRLMKGRRYPADYRA